MKQDRVISGAVAALVLAALRLCRVPTLFFEFLAPLAKPCSAPANLRQHSSGLAIHGANDRGRAMLAPAM